VSRSAGTAKISEWIGEVTSAHHRRARDLVELAVNIVRLGN
jgi:hypothetical protein